MSFQKNNKLWNNKKSISTRFASGKKPWNFGLTKQTDKRVALNGKMVGISLTGTKQTKDTIKKRLISNGLGANWRGGITPKNRIIRASIEFRLWRESVFAKDNWICQKCKTKGGYLHPHHILNFAKWIELRFAIDNGITLCRDCHNKFHKIYGLRKNNKEQLREYLYGKI